MTVVVVKCGGLPGPEEPRLLARVVSHTCEARGSSHTWETGLRTHLTADPDEYGPEAARHEAVAGLGLVTANYGSRRRGLRRSLDAPMGKQLPVKEARVPAIPFFRPSRGRQSGLHLRRRSRRLRHPNELPANRRRTIVIGPLRSETPLRQVSSCRPGRPGRSFAIGAVLPTPVMIHPQVHLRIPCYDFYFL